MNKEVKGPENNVSIDDEIGQEMKQAQVRELKKEYAHFVTALKEKEDALDLAERALKVDLAGYDIALSDENYRKLTPEFRYEQLDEYWVVKKQQLDLEKEVLISKSEKAIATLKSHIEQIKEQQVSAASKIKELGGSVE